MAWTDTLFNFLGRGRYNTVSPSPVNGDSVELQVTGDGSLKVATTGATFDASGRQRTTQDSATVGWAGFGAAISVSVKASPGKLYELQITNPAGTDTWVRITDGGTLIAPPVRLKTLDTVGISWPGGRAFGTNCIVACFTTAAGGTADTPTLYVQAKFE